MIILNPPLINVIQSFFWNVKIYKKAFQIKSEKLIDFIWQNGYNNDRKDK